MSKTIYHKHHIIPKHMGGTDDPSNLVRLTVEEHAQAHKELFEKHGKREDYIAYKALSGQMSISDAKIEAQRLGASRGGKIGGKIGGKNSPPPSIESARLGGINAQKKNPLLPSIGGRALWKKEGMREHLIEQRKLQSKNGKNPMQGKKQKRVCCVQCKKEMAINVFGSHTKKKC